MTELGKVFKEHTRLSKVDISKMNIQELTKHSLELQRLSKLGLKLVDEQEARQKNPTKIN